VNHSEIVSFLWGVADLIRDTFKRGKYQDVILPLTVLRRLDCVLPGTKDRVLKRQAELKGKGLEDLDAQLRRASGFAFYNTSRYDFEKLLADAPHLAANLRNYIAGFSPNIREVLEKFDFDNTISKLDEAGLLFQVLERFKKVELHPERVDNPTMGTIFEELLRRPQCASTALRAPQVRLWPETQALHYSVPEHVCLAYPARETNSDTSGMLRHPPDMSLGFPLLQARQTWSLQPAMAPSSQPPRPCRGREVPETRKSRDPAANRSTPRVRAGGPAMVA
jgi:HsdM-like protein